MTLDQASADYNFRFEGALRSVGIVSCGTVDVLPRVREICPEFNVVAYRSEDTMFYISKGCHRFCDESSNNRDEFVIHRVMSDAVSVRLINLVSFYHMSCRSVIAADIIEIGHVDNLDPRFTHIVIRVPQFFPPEVNRIEIAGLVYNLSWIMPIRCDEFGFIRSRGLDEFERRLDASRHGFFDIRNDVSYLSAE